MEIEIIGIIKITVQRADNAGDIMMEVEKNGITDNDIIAILDRCKHAVLNNDTSTRRVEPCPTTSTP